MSAKSDELLKLARAAFPDLYEAEKKVVAAAADGQPADFSTGDKAKDDPEKADAWGPERTVRARRLGYTLTQMGRAIY